MNDELYFRLDGSDYLLVPRWQTRDEHRASDFVALNRPHAEYVLRRALGGLPDLTARLSRAGPPTLDRVSSEYRLHGVSRARAYAPCRAQYSDDGAVSEAEDIVDADDWIEVRLEDDGGPLANVVYELTFADGTVRRGRTNSGGSLRYDSIVSGECTIAVLDLAGGVWEAV